MATQIKRAGGGMKLDWNSRKSVVAFAAAVGIAFVTLLSLGLGTDNFWDGIIAGFLVAILFAVPIYVKMNGIPASKIVPQELRSRPLLQSVAQVSRIRR